MGFLDASAVCLARCFGGEMRAGGLASGRSARNNSGSCHLLRFMMACMLRIISFIVRLSSLLSLINFSAMYLSEWTNFKFLFRYY